MNLYVSCRLNTHGRMRHVLFGLIGSSHCKVISISSMMFVYICIKSFILIFSSVIKPPFCYICFLSVLYICISLNYARACVSKLYVTTP